MKFLIFSYCYNFVVLLTKIEEYHLLSSSRRSNLDAKNVIIVVVGVIF